MARRCGSWLLVLSLVLTTGGHWAILQACAWAGMLVRYSQEGPVRAAIERTFDGRHPCRLCKLVRDGRTDERKRSSPIVVSRFDLLPSNPASGITPPSIEGPPAAFPSASPPPSRHDAPPVPPPRHDRPVLA